MSKRVRVIVDFDVTQGDTDKVVDMLSEHRKNIASYAGQVLVGASGKTIGTRVELSGGVIHVHPTDGERCGTCRAVSDSPALPSLE